MISMIIKIIIIYPFYMQKCHLIIFNMQNIFGLLT